jgi:hypothetical protein
MRETAISTDAIRISFAHQVVIFLTAAAVFLIGVMHPYYNWDIVGYVAAAHYEDGLRGEMLRDRTYDDIRDEVGKYMFAHLTDGPYRQTVYEYPQSLQQQVPFYSIKIVYVELVRVAGRFGLSYAQGTFWVSAFFSALSVVVLGILSCRMLLPAPVLPLLVLGAGHLDVARMSVPDGLACFFSLLAVLFALTRSRWLYVVSAVLPLMRTDYLILSVLLMIYEYRNGQRSYAMLSLIASVVAYVCVSGIWGGYGWLTLFNFTLITGAVPFPAEINISERLSDYIAPYGRVWSMLLHSHQFVIYCLAAFVIVKEFGRQKSSREFWMLFVIPFTFLVLHLGLFPLYEDRFFGFVASLTLLGIFVLLHRTSWVATDRGDRSS